MMVNIIYVTNYSNKLLLIYAFSKDINSTHFLFYSVIMAVCRKRLIYSAVFISLLELRTFPLLKY